MVVSKDAVDRALHAANTMYLALERRGHQVTSAPTHQQFHRPEVREGMNRDDSYYYRSRWKPCRPTYAYVGSLAIGPTLFELSKEAEAEYEVSSGTYVRA